MAWRRRGAVVVGRKKLLPQCFAQRDSIDTNSKKSLNSEMHAHWFSFYLQDVPLHNAQPHWSPLCSIGTVLIRVGGGGTRPNTLRRYGQGLLPGPSFTFCYRVAKKPEHLPISAQGRSEQLSGCSGRLILLFLPWLTPRVRPSSSFFLPASVCKVPRHQYCVKDPY